MTPQLGDWACRARSLKASWGLVQTPPPSTPQNSSEQPELCCAPSLAFVGGFVGDEKAIGPLALRKALARVFLESFWHLSQHHVVQFTLQSGSRGVWEPKVRVQGGVFLLDTDLSAP